MPKMKSHGGTQKRFRVTRTGLVLRMKGHRSHNKTKKNQRNIHAMRDMHPVETAGERKRIKTLLPYGSGD